LIEIKLKICRHECDLSQTTDIAQRPEFSQLKRRSAWNRDQEGYFSEDFTLAEIRTLRTKERLDASIRTHNFDGLYQVITLEEFLQLAQALVSNDTVSPVCSKEELPYVGVYIETKTPAHFHSLGYDVETTLLEILSNFGYEHRCKEVKESAVDKNQWIRECGVILQSFENNLASLDAPYPLVQLLEEGDEIQADTQLPYSDLMTKEGLEQIKTWAVGIGPSKYSCLNYSSESHESFGLIELAHSVDLLVHPYTFRPELAFLNSVAFGNDSTAEFRAFFDLGVDGVFTDSADGAVKAAEDYYINEPYWAWCIEIGFYVLTIVILLCFFSAVLLSIAFYIRQRKRNGTFTVVEESEA